MSHERETGRGREGGEVSVSASRCLRVSRCMRVCVEVSVLEVFVCIRVCMCMRMYVFMCLCFIRDDLAEHRRTCTRVQMGIKEHKNEDCQETIKHFQDGQLLNFSH